MTIPLEIREVLVCDDIRREDNGKAILIGVYFADMLFSSFPVSARLCFWMQGRARKDVGSGETQFKIEVAGSEHPPVFVDAKFDTPPTEHVGGVLVFMGVPITVKQPGRLILSMRNDDGEWTELMSKEIKQNESANQVSSEPSLPS